MFHLAASALIWQALLELCDVKVFLSFHSQSGRVVEKSPVGKEALSSAQLWRLVCPVTAGGEKEVPNNGPIEMDKAVGLLALGGYKQQPTL